MDLLFHTSKYKTSVLDPAKYNEKCIYLSKGSFVSALGEWLYIFDYNILSKYFEIKHQYSGGIFYNFKTSDYDPKPYSFRYESKPLEVEYMIYESIDVEKFSIGVAENFNICEGIMQGRIRDKTFKMIVDLL